MAELRLERVGKRFGAVTAVRRALARRRRAANSSSCSGRAAPARRRRCASSPASRRPISGSVFIGGEDVTATAPALRDVTFVFQQYSLYPHLSVYDNLAFPLRSPLRRDRRRPRCARRCSEIARLLRIEDKLASPATRLSGGQMQRVAIGRALVREPAVTLMDEPLSSLDAKLRNDLRLELKRIQQDLGATMLYVTHDQTEALTLATRIGVLDHGRLAQVGSPREIYEDPQTSAVAARLGSPRINLVPRSALGAWPAPTGAVTVGVRAEHLHVAPARAGGGPTLRATVRRIEIAERPAPGAPGARRQRRRADQRRAGARRGRARQRGRASSCDRPLWFDAAGRRVAG